MSAGFWDDAEVIYAYTREQAISDGVLVDVSKIAREAGFNCNTVITQALHSVLEPTAKEKSYGQSYEGRLWDVVFMASLPVKAYIRRNNPTDNFRLVFKVIVAVEKKGSGLKQVTHTLYVDMGYGDHGEVVCTIGYPKDF